MSDVAEAQKISERAVGEVERALNFWSEIFSVIVCKTDTYEDGYWRGVVTAHVAHYGDVKHTVSLTIETDEPDNLTMYMSDEGEVTGQICPENVWLKLYSDLSQNFTKPALPKDT